MLEGFCEYLVTHKKTPQDYVLEVGYILAGFVGAAACLFTGNLLRLHVIGIFAALTAVVLGIRAAALHKWEYEYTLTAGAMDIDQVIARRKRKRMLSFDCRDCEIIAPANRGTYMQSYASLPLWDYSASPTHPENYFAVIERSGAKIRVMFEASEPMLQMLKDCNPRKVFLA